jgi:hypothetical protein
VTGQICDIDSKKFHKWFRDRREGPKYMIFIKITTEELLFLQLRPCLGAEHGDHDTFDLPKWLEH